MAAGQICDTIQSETHNHHAGADVHRTYFLFRLRPVLSGTHEQRSLDTYVYRGLTTLNNVGMSAAAGFYQSIVGFILVLTANMIVRKVSRENALF